MPPEACHSGAKPRRAVDEKQNCGLRVGEANGLAMASFGFTLMAVSPDRAASDHSMRARMPESSVNGVESEVGVCSGVSVVSKYSDSTCPWRCVIRDRQTSAVR